MTQNTVTHWREQDVLMLHKKVCNPALDNHLQGSSTLFLISAISYSWGPLTITEMFPRTQPVTEFYYF